MGRVIYDLLCHTSHQQGVFMQVYLLMTFKETIVQDFGRVRVFFSSSLFLRETYGSLICATCIDRYTSMVVWTKYNSRWSLRELK